MRTLLLLPVALLLGTCSGPGGGDAGLDAGSDAHDAGRDAPRRDTPTPDVPRDTSDTPADGGPDDPGWHPISGLPETCVIERATHPERVRRPFFEACLDTAGAPVAGCERAVGLELREVFATEDGLWSRRKGGDRGHDIDSLGPLDGPATAAWRSPDLDPDDNCTVRNISTGPAGLAAVSFMTGLSRDDTLQELIYVAPRAEIGRAEVPEMVFPASYLVGGRYLDHLWPAETITFYLMAGDNSVIGHRRADDLYVHLSNPWGGSPQNVAMLYGEGTVPDRLLWERWSSFVHLSEATFEGGWHDLLDVSGDNGMVRSLSVNEGTIVWIQGYDYDGLRYARNELWTAPVTDDLSSMAPRRVRDVRVHDGGVNGARWFARLEVLEGVRSVVIYDLADGARRVWLPPDGTVVSDSPFFVAGDWVYVHVVSNTYRFDARTAPVTP